MHGKGESTTINARSHIHGEISVPGFAMFSAIFDSNMSGYLDF